MMTRKLFLLVFAAALLTAFGCSSGGDGGMTAFTLACTDGSATAPVNGVTLVCGGTTGGTTEKVNVVIVGPVSGSTTLRGLHFDVIYDPSKLIYVPAASDTSPLFSPNALVAVGLSNGEPGDLVVSIREFGGVVDPVSVGPGQHVVLSLSFRRASEMNSFSPTALTFQNAEATTASTTIDFGSALALSYQ